MMDFIGLPEPGVLVAVTIASLFAVAAVARWLGYDRRVPFLGVVADWVPGVPPLAIAVSLLLAIPLVVWLERAAGSRSPDTLLALAFMVLLTVATTVVILARRGAISSRMRDLVLGIAFAMLLLATALISPVIRDSIAGAIFGLASLLVAAAIAYAYARTRRSTDAD